MDCRWSLVLTACLTYGCLGCVSRQTVPPAGTASPDANRPSDSSQVAVKTTPENEKPRRKPKPSMCVAFGKWRESALADPNLTADEVEHCREEARKLYQQAIDLDPNYLPAYSALAHLYDSIGDHPRAVATYETALKKHPREAAVWADLGMSHARQKEWEPCLVCLRKAMELDPENRQTSKTLGFCLARAGFYEESFASLKQSVGEAQAHYDLARMLFHLNQNEEGKRQLELAIQANPRLEQAQELLAELEGRVPQPADADPAPAPEGSAN